MRNAYFRSAPCKSARSASDTELRRQPCATPTTQGWLRVGGVVRAALSPCVCYSTEKVVGGIRELGHFTHLASTAVSGQPSFHLAFLEPAGLWQPLALALQETDGIGSLFH